MIRRIHAYIFETLTPINVMANLLSRRKVAHCWQKPSKWGKLNQHSYDDPAFRGHIRGGGGYAVICNFGNLVCLDLDDLERLLELGARLDLLPQTLTVKTGRTDGKGRHFYFYCQDLKQKYIFNDPEIVKPDKNGKMKPIQLGSLQAGWSYVVGPGSLHPNGQIYEIIVDAPIATISGDLFWQVMGSIPRKQEKSKDRIARIKRAAKKSEAMNVDLQDHKNISSCVPVESVIELWENETRQKLEIESRDGPTIIASHPFHGSDSGHNFHLNIEKNVWTCFREARPGGEPGGSGGSGLELYAIYRGFLKCEECLPGCLYGKRFWEVVESAIEDGFEIPDEILDRYRGNQTRTTNFEIIPSRKELVTLPDDLPAEKAVVVKGPPRIGKTHWAMGQLLKWGSGTYLTHNYAIIDHALEIFRDLGGKGAVLVEGKNREGLCRCDQPLCESCKLKPDETKKIAGHVGYFELQAIANKLLQKHPILTKRDIPLDVCPYYCLRLAIEDAKYVFTVVHNIDRINVSNRKNVVIDEDTTLDYFYPSSPAIARIKRVVNHHDVRIYLNDIMNDISGLTEVIESKQHKMKRDKELLKVFQKIKDINDALLDARSKQDPVDEISDKIGAIVLQGYQEKSEDEILDILASLDGYYHPSHAQEDDVVDLREVVTAVLHPYKERPAHLINSGNGYKTVHLIGDAHNPLINTDWISSSHKIVIIGATKAEYFARRIDDKPFVIEISKFKYARNFAVIPIDQDDQKIKEKCIPTTTEEAPENSHAHIRDCRFNHRSTSHCFCWIQE